MESEYLYRYQEYSTIDYNDFISHSLDCRKYKILSNTPKGCWISLYGESLDLNIGKKFVLNDSN